MSFHFCSHSWEVRDIQGGTLVTMTPRDLHPETTAVLVDELFELVQESGEPNLVLDFAAVHQLASVVIGKLIALDSMLREHRGRLVLLNVNPFVYQLFDAAQLTDALDIRRAEPADTIF